MSTPNTVNNPNDPQDPTAGYRPKPKGPNFLGIVIASVIVLLIGMIIVVLLLRTSATKLDPHKPTATPNSRLILPFVPSLHGAGAGLQSHSA